jgi:hypothetical protein
MAADSGLAPATSSTTKGNNPALGPTWLLARLWSSPSKLASVVPSAALVGWVHSVPLLAASTITHVRGNHSTPQKPRMTVTVKAARAAGGYSTVGIPFVDAEDSPDSQERGQMKEDNKFAIVSSMVLLAIALLSFNNVSWCQSLSATPSPLKLGWTLVGTTSTLPVKVSAASATTITGITTVEPFSVEPLQYPYSLAAGANVMLEVTFTPTKMGQAGPQPLTITYTGGSLVVDLYGTGSHRIQLSWDGSTTPDVEYNVYRGTTSGGPYTLLNEDPIDALTYRDAFETDGSDTFYYVVMAVNSAGVQSPRSNQVQAVVPSP